MPEISRFLGIIIYTNWGDHPLPHLHARYGAFELTVEIQSGRARGYRNTDTFITMIYLIGSPTGSVLKFK